MVTLEQKLSLFSKLLQQDVQNEIGEKIENLEKEYEGIRQEHKRQVDKEARHIIERAEKKGEEKRLELISKARMQSKKQSVSAKEKYIEIFLKQLKERFKAFTATKDYELYLTGLIQNLKTLNPEDMYTLYLTPADYENYGDFMKQELKRIGLDLAHYQFVADGPELLGGFILDEKSKNIRIDLSVNALIEDQKDDIVARIFAAIGEVGEANE